MFCHNSPDCRERYRPEAILGDVLPGSLAPALWYRRLDGPVLHRETPGDGVQFLLCRRSAPRYRAGQLIAYFRQAIDTIAYFLRQSSTGDHALIKNKLQLTMY